MNEALPKSPPPNSANKLEDLTVKIQVATQCSREKAEAAARLNLRLPPPPEKSAVEIQRDASIAEDKEQHEIVKMFRAYGLKVYSSSQKRAAKVSPGFPDLVVTKRSNKIAFFFETKRQVGGRYSTEQEEFRDDQLAAGARWYGGDRYAAAAVLVELGLAVSDGAGVNGISPKRDLL